MNIVNELIELANNSGADASKKYYHVNGLMRALRCAEDAKLIKKIIVPNTAILDLCCGHGQMSYIMKRLSLNVSVTDLRIEIPYFISSFFRFICTKAYVY